ncbi:MAG TPA: hypothetical protein VM285_07755 [Polyangia bacterium]|nr:hypothetical protein [Polyangia bacterium]
MPQTTGETVGPIRDRALLLSAAAALVLAVLASGWEFLASQSPSSPLHVGPLAGPVSRLAMTSWLAGIAGLVLWSVLGRLGLPPERIRRSLRFALAGWWLLCAGLVLGAVLGTHGVQVIGAYPRGVAVLLFKLAGFVSLAAFAVDFLSACLGRSFR